MLAVAYCDQLNETPVESGIGEIIIYNPDDSVHLEVRIEQESVWLSQLQMGTLFGVDRTVIVKHIKKYTKAENWMKWQPVQKLHMFEKREDGRLQDPKSSIILT